MLRCLIVDDEPLAREALKQALCEMEDLTVEEAADGMCALEAMAKQPFDCVFLDIHMPEMDGFEMLEQMPKRDVAVVFVTAYDQHAIRAFEECALDYILKPADTDRVHATVERVRAQIAGRTVASMFERATQASRQLHEPQARIAIKSGGKFVFVEPREIVFVEAEGNYVLFHTRSARHMLRETIQEVERRLAQHGFLRIHRSIIVNANLIQEIQPSATGEYMLRLKDGKEFAVTKTYKRNLQRIATGALGTASSSVPFD
jgi:two-component system LytT family response regulator